MSAKQDAAKKLKFSSATINWRIRPATKDAFLEFCDRGGYQKGRLLDRILNEWLKSHQTQDKGA